MTELMLIQYRLT